MQVQSAAGYPQPVPGAAQQYSVPDFSGVPESYAWGPGGVPIQSRRSDLKRETQKNMDKGKAGLGPAFPPDNWEVINEVSFFSLDQILSSPPV